MSDCEPITRTRREPMVAIKVSLEHFSCGGNFVATGNSISTLPTLYEHRCDACGARLVKDESYPRIEYEPVEGAGPPSTR